MNINHNLKFNYVQFKPMQANVSGEPDIYNARSGGELELEQQRQSEPDVYADLKTPLSSSAEINAAYAKAFINQKN